MYGSYGSYSSMSPISIGTPLDVTSSNMLAHDRSCAFPSWPHRDSLSASQSDRPSLYLSDDDLFPPEPTEDDARSISSADSGFGSGVSPAAEEELLRMERERQAMQREAALRYIVTEKERRRQAMHAKRQRARQAQGGASGSSRKTSKSKLASMTPIAEVGE